MLLYLQQTAQKSEPTVRAGQADHVEKHRGTRKCFKCNLYVTTHSWGVIGTPLKLIPSVRLDLFASVTVELPAFTMHLSIQRQGVGLHANTYITFLPSTGIKEHEVRKSLFSNESPRPGALAPKYLRKAKNNH
jgi:hypothetical protein